jgi:type IV pilus assembly protein PilM
MKTSTTSIIALDIGTFSIKYLEASRSKDNKLTIHQAAMHTIGSESSDSLEPVLKPLLPLLTASPDNVRLVISGSSLLVRCVPMPVMSKEELGGAIRFEAENHIAFPIDDCILDFQIINESADKKTMNVLLVAAKRDFIQERLRMLSDLNIHPELIDADTFCLVNAFEAFNSEAELGSTYALLNIGHRVTSFAIVQDKLPLFVRDVPIGGLAISKALGEAKGMSEADADQLKISNPAEIADELTAATHKGLETLMDEIKHSIEFFETSGGAHVGTVYLSGGGALCPSTPAILTEGLGKTVSMWDNLKKIEIGPTADKKFLQENSGLLNVALGLLLRR